MLKMKWTLMCTGCEIEGSAMNKLWDICKETGLNIMIEDSDIKFDWETIFINKK